MSYILDALRRADAERERGAVPGIHAQPFGQLPGDDEAPTRSRLPLWIILGLSIALLAALAWNFLAPPAGRNEGAAAPNGAPAGVPSGVPAGVPSVAQAPPAIVAAAPTAAPPAAAPPAAVPQPGPGGAQGTTRTHPEIELPKPVRKAVPRKAAPPAASDERAAEARSANARAPDDRGAEKNRAASAEKNRSADAEKNRGAEGEKRIVALRDLPDAVRRELPNIVVGGSTWSSSRESRMLMIGGQIFHEGDAVAKGVVLRTIKPHAAVFAYRDYLYEIAF